MSISKQPFFLFEKYSPNAFNLHLKKIKSIKIQSPSSYPKINKQLSPTGKRGTLTGARPIGPLNPQYPPRSRRLGHQGQVKVGATISKYGNVAKIIVIKSSGFYELDEEAKRTVREALFYTATRDGLAIEDQQEFVFNFQLK